MPRSYPKLEQRLFERPIAIEPRAFRGILAALAPRFPHLDLGIGAGDAIAVPKAWLDDEEEEEKEPEQVAPYQIRDGVAVINVIGELVHRSSWMNAFSGLVSYEELGAAFRQAVADPNAKSILLRMDSPGGEVAGLNDLADEIYESRSKKPTFAIAEDMACSAAYLLASACEKFYATQGAMTGSIGVVWTHISYGEAMKQRGVVVTHVHAGKRKVDGSPYQVLEGDSLKALQFMVDSFYEIFTSKVATFRGMSQDDVKDTEAGVYIGAAAEKHGLIDGVRTVDACIRELAIAGASPAPLLASKVNPAPAAGGAQKETSMTPEEIKQLEEENAKLKAAAAAREIADEQRETEARESVFAKHAKRLTPATMVTMRAKLAMSSAKDADEVLALVPDQVHPKPDGSSADVAPGAKKQDPDLELLDRAKALQKEKPNLSLGSACNEILAKDPAFAERVHQWREENPGPVVNLDQKFRKEA